MLVKQDCDEYSFTWGISEEVHETTVGKREGLGAFRFFFKQLGKESCTLIDPWSPSKVASVTGTTLRPVLTLCRRTLGIDPIACISKHEIQLACGE